MNARPKAWADDALAPGTSAGYQSETGRRPRVPERAIRLDDNRYVLQEPLQQTGSTATWCAWDAPLERMVALRIFRCPSDDFLKALARDVHASRNVNHRHVLRIERYGRCATTGLIFVEEELCAEFAEGRRRFGKTLAHTHPRSAREAARWAREIALGVHAAHEEGVFHGAITADCVWIRPETRRAQVAHFGQAMWRRADPSAPDVPFSPRDCVVLDVPPEGTGAIRGAPCYMAPEQARGSTPDEHSADPVGRARQTLIDVYGVGAVLYELLVGAAPYLPQPLVDDPIQDVLSQVRSRPPLPASERRDLPPRKAFHVPDALRRIQARAMARDPLDRYPSAADLAADLAAFLQGSPTLATAPSLRARAWLWTRRHVHAIGLSLSILTSLVAVVAALALYDEVVEARKRLRDMEREINTAYTQGPVGDTLEPPR